ncbi:MAG: SRPBCC family protein [Woeseiaceae bacterium]
MNKRSISLATVVAGALLLAFSAQLSAAELRYVEVNREDGLYSLRSVAWFDAKPDDLYAVLVDYEQFKRFTSAIVESRNIGQDAEGRPEFYTRMEGCVLFWCRSFVRIGHLKLDPIQNIVAITDPERSDFKVATEEWQLVEEGNGTLMTYEFAMIPDFWVPPVIGPYYIKRALKAGGEKALSRIEALARGEEPPK